MFCSNCGKEISNQAKFCNHCGTPVNNAPAQTSSAAQSAPAKKKGKAGSTFLSLVLVAAVFFGARFITEKFLADQNKDSSQGYGKIEINNQDSNFEKGFKEALEEDPDIQDAMSSCMYGALYQNDELRYGMTKLVVPGYSLLEGEDEERDWLMSPDGACLIAAYRQLEIPDVSYDASTEEGMLASYRQTYSDASIMSYEKYYVNGFPVINYIIAYTANDIYQYQGELVIFPSETTGMTIRLTMFVDVASGYGSYDIQKIFDTLEVSTELTMDLEDTGALGLNTITVK